MSKEPRWVYPASLVGYWVPFPTLLLTVGLDSATDAAISFGSPLLIMALIWAWWRKQFDK